MTSETKSILWEALNKFNSADSKQQKLYVKHVQKMVKIGKEDLIGFPPNPNIMQAGEIFLRIFKNK
jgi:hypothetical protein